MLKESDKLINDNYVGEKITEKEETTELTDDEKKELIKSHHLNYTPKKRYGIKYKKERARKNRQSKKSRKLNQKK